MGTANRTGAGGEGEGDGGAGQRGERGAGQPNGAPPADALLPHVARALRRLLEEQGINQKTIAEELGVTESTVSRWLSRRQGMPMRTLQCFAQRLGVPLETLFAERPGAAAEAQAPVPWEQLQQGFDALIRHLRLVTLYRCGTRGDPRTASERELGPVGYQLVPPGHDALLGGRPFALMVDTDHMAGRGLFPGDAVFVNPDAPWGLGGLVAAMVDGTLRLREVARDPEGRTVVRTAPEQGPQEVNAGDAFRIVGPVVLALAVSVLPGGRGNARERPQGDDPGGTGMVLMAGDDPANGRAR